MLQVLVYGVRRNSNASFLFFPFCWVWVVVVFFFVWWRSEEKTRMLTAVSVIQLSTVWPCRPAMTTPLAPPSSRCWVILWSMFLFISLSVLWQALGCFHLNTSMLLGSSWRCLNNLTRKDIFIHHLNGRQWGKCFGAYKVLGGWGHLLYFWQTKIFTACWAFKTQNPSTSGE